MKELLLLIGPPGSGKTTYCEKFLIPSGYTHVSQDNHKGNREAVYKEFMQALNEGKDKIVIDRMNFNVKQRERWIIPARNLGYKIIGLDFVVSNIFRERAKARTDHQTLKAEKVDEVTDIYIKNYQMGYSWDAELKKYESTEFDEYNYFNQVNLELKKA